MRPTTLFRRMLGVTQMFVERVSLEQEGLILDVRPSWLKPRCGVCRKKRPCYDRKPARLWRSLGWGRLKCWLRYAPRRVRCQRCGVRTEEVPWARLGSYFSRDFEEMVAYLAQVTDKTKVSTLMGISWATVGKILERVVLERLDRERFDDLERIGIDEFGYRKRHRYLTVVVDHDSQTVVWAGEGRSAATLRRFVQALDPERREKIRLVTMDMAGGYRKAVEEGLPWATIVFDRFHVQRLASDAVDEVRREQLRQLRGTKQGRSIFKSRYPLLKNRWNLNRTDRQKLKDIQRNNAPLYRAYLLKEALAHALDYERPKRAERALKEWLAWASRSRLRPFVRAARTVRKHFQGILAYVSYRLTNGLVEGINNKVRMVARRAFGFHGAGALIGMIYLCCGGILLDPPLPTLDWRSP